MFHNKRRTNENLHNVYSVFVCFITAAPFQKPLMNLLVKYVVNPVSLGYMCIKQHCAKLHLNFPFSAAYQGCPHLLLPTVTTYLKAMTDNGR